MSVRWPTHSTRDYLFTGFIIFSAVAVAVRAVTSHYLFDESEANRSDSSRPTEVTPLNRALIVIVCAFIVGVAILQFFK